MNHTTLRYDSSLPAEVHSILQAILRASIEIQRAIRFQMVHRLQGKQKLHQNASGDVQEELDVLSNTIMVMHLIQSKACNILISEENECPIQVPAEQRGTHLVAFDPLDGSSNLECNGPVGTIFSIYENKREEIYLPSSHLRAAGYILYGPATELVIAAQGQVQRYVLDSQQKYEYVGTLQIPKNGKEIYSINEASSAQWGPDIRKWIEGYKAPGTKYTARYIGSMVADVHRTLLYGGVFCYPADKKNVNGKLRLFYECIPMAYIIELAGGKAIVGKASTQRILELVPKELHQRSPILLGSVQEIETYQLRSKL